MGKFLGIVIIWVALFLAALSLYVIRTNDGFEVITKNELTLRDTYVDVRNWGITDYLAHSDRIRNYLFYTKHYQPLKKAVAEKMSEIHKKAKEDLRPIEKSFHEWVSKKPK